MANRPLAVEIWDQNGGISEGEGRGVKVKQLLSTGTASLALAPLCESDPRAGFGANRPRPPSAEARPLSKQASHWSSCPGLTCAPGTVHTSACRAGRMTDVWTSSIIKAPAPAPEHRHEASARAAGASTSNRPPSSPSASSPPVPRRPSSFDARGECSCAVCLLAVPCSYSPCLTAAAELPLCACSRPPESAYRSPGKCTAPGPEAHASAGTRNQATAAPQSVSPAAQDRPSKPSRNKAGSARKEDEGGEEKEPGIEDADSNVDAARATLHAPPPVHLPVPSPGIDPLSQVRLGGHLYPCSPPPPPAGADVCRRSTFSRGRTPTRRPRSA